MNIASAFSSAHISVHLAHDSLMVCEVQRRWGLRRLTRTASFAFAPGQRAQAMTRLSQWIAAAPVRRTLGWVIGPSEAQYFVLPWSPEATHRTLRDSYARARYEQLYGQDAGETAFSFAEPAKSGEQLVSCIPLALSAEIQALAKATACRLTSIKPSLASVWERFRHVLETEQGTLCLIDGDRQAIVHYDRRRIEHIEVANVRPGLAMRSAGVIRRFSNNAASRPCATDLRLPRWRGGHTEAEDSRYAFALCGAM